ncbi:MAG: Maf family protein [Candidatus Hodarchaeaceae archaeon]|nr:Maf family protein [Candidatus Hodarchaeaceae archaeon]
MRKITLASASPRRRELLEQVGLPCEVMPSEVAEHNFGMADPETLVKRLALSKARDVARKVKEGIVIGADTVVVYKGKILGKPSDEADAERMLRKISGREHEVMTGLAIVDIDQNEEAVECVKTKVKFRRLSTEEIREYIATGEPLDKAGAYGVQGKGATLVESIEGCYYNVVGLPLAKLIEMLKSLGAAEESRKRG